MSRVLLKFSGGSLRLRDLLFLSLVRPSPNIVTAMRAGNEGNHQPDQVVEADES
jgi:hypothetical protein